MLDEIDSLRRFAIYPNEEMILDNKADCLFPKEQGNIVYLESLNGLSLRFGLLINSSEKSTDWVLGNNNISLSEYTPVYSYFTPHQLGLGDLKIKKGNLVYHACKTYEVAEDVSLNSDIKQPEIKCVQLTAGKKHIKRAEVWNNFSVQMKLFLSFLKKEFGAKNRVIVYSKIVSNYALKSSNRNFVFDILVDDMFISNKDLIYYSNFFGFNTPHVLFTSETFKLSIVHTYIGCFSKSIPFQYNLIPPVIERILIKSENSCPVQDRKIFAYINPSKLNSTLTRIPESSPLQIHI